MINKKLIVVLGMHRSGTSAITRALTTMGVELGDSLMPSNNDVNAKGFWEDIEINEFNIELLNAIDRDWQHLSGVVSTDINILREKGFIHQAAELLNSKADSTAIFGFKDPRVTKLLPFWKEVFKQCQFDVSYVIAVRNPLSVAKSLAKRDNLEMEQSYLLWLGHVVSSLNGSNKYKRVIVDYDRLIQLPERELNRIANCAELSIDKEQLNIYENEFLDQKLQHTIFNLKELSSDNTCPPIVKEVYSVLLDVASDKITLNDILDKITLWSDEVERLKSSFKLIDKLFEQQIVTVQAVADRERQISELTQIVADREGQISERTQIVDNREGQISELTQIVDDREGQISELKQIVDDREGQISELTQAVSERDARIAELTIEMEQRGEWALRLNNELEIMRNQIKDITSSHSWLITFPFRELRKWIFSPWQQFKRYIKYILRTLRKVYLELPLSFKAKTSHKKIIEKLFPKFLTLSGCHVPIVSDVGQLNVKNNKASKILNYKSNDLDSINIKSFDKPFVSIIIPIYGKVDYTIRCLKSISQNSPLVDFEIIVVDDCSPDNSAKTISDIKNIRLISNKDNQGFIRSCNIGAKTAKGEYLYFLNNDTEVTQGCLDELVRTFDEFPGAGLVGSKLIYPNGALQEAGGIIWQDGSAWNFGRNQDPSLPIYNYAREVDYCSGASIMVPKKLFDDLGGFDEYYLPAYYEDVDLALKIRTNGYRVIYQPLSVVVHYEGITSGKDTAFGVKTYQVENAKKFYERWHDRLLGHQSPGVDPHLAKDRCAKKRVLVLDHCTPTPNQDAGSVIVFNLMLLLREMNFQVTFIPEDNFLYMPEYTTALQRMGVEVLYAPYVTKLEQHLNEYGDRYDLALLIRPAVMENHIKAIRKLCPKAKVLFYTVDLHFLRMMREATLLNDASKMKTAEQMQQRELAAMREADATIVVSTAELEILKPKLPGEKIHVLPLIMNVQGTRKSFSERKDIVFVGGFQHEPNIDAVKYFVNEIMVLLRPRLPGVRFIVVGSKVPEEINALSCDDVIIKGFVENLNPLFDEIRVSVAPLRYGAGIKGKIGSAMAVGLPVVATPIAVEGMSLENKEDILVADGAEQFADAILSLYQDENLWNLISLNGLDFVESAWGAEAAWKNLNVILADLDISTVRGEFPLSLYSSLDSIPKRNIHKEDELTPIASVKNREDFNLVIESDSIKKIKEIEKNLLESSDTEAFRVNGFCVPCNKNVPLLVDMLSGGERQGSSWLPNWRERLECPLCGMNNRQRLIATLIKQELNVELEKQVYFMEQVTPIYNWATSTFRNHNIVGSEYLGYEYEGGSIIKGIRHEDVEKLSFSSGSLDFIVSNDVFEHVPNPAKAFEECARVLKIGGVMLATIPFHSMNDKSIVRATIEQGRLKHILPPSYHGNPVSSDGSLVFTDFGWDVLNEMRSAGFSDVSIDVYASTEFCHLGGGQLVFRLIK